jgi:signal transduction histidine kinase
VNLLRNAVEAIADSGAATGHIIVRIENTDEGTMISVTDTGPGFNETLDLFEQFESTKEDGMGLGLSICRTIVEAHRGQLWYEKDALGRSRFCFTLPSLAPKPKPGRQNALVH